MGFIKEWQDKLGVTIVCSQVGLHLGRISGLSSAQLEQLLSDSCSSSNWA